MSKHAGAEWLDQPWLNRKKWRHGQEMSPLGREVANLLGQVYSGLYHLDGGALERVDWSDPYYIGIVLRYPQLATFDYSTLTKLVVLCHDRMLRMNIRGCGPNLTRLEFWQRTTRNGGISQRMPTIETQIANIRAYHGEVLPQRDEVS